MMPLHIQEPKKSKPCVPAHSTLFHCRNSRFILIFMQTRDVLEQRIAQIVDSLKGEIFQDTLLRVIENELLDRQRCFHSASGPFMFAPFSLSCDISSNFCR